MTNIITGYPTGISFSDLEHGYIATSYHRAESYLFHTTDQGMTWVGCAILRK